MYAPAERTETFSLFTLSPPHRRRLLHSVVVPARQPMQPGLAHRVHRVATAALWRTFCHEGKISLSGKCGRVHAHPLSLHLPSPVKLQCTLQLSGLYSVAGTTTLCYSQLYPPSQGLWIGPQYCKPALKWASKTQKVIPTVQCSTPINRIIKSLNILCGFNFMANCLRIGIHNLRKPSPRLVVCTVLR